MRRKKGSAFDRLRWAKDRWREDITIPIQGPNGMIHRLYEEFGRSGASYDKLADIRERVVRERAEVTKVAKKEKKKMSSAAPFNPPRLTVASVESSKASTSDAPGDDKKALGRNESLKKTRGARIAAVRSWLTDFVLAHGKGARPKNEDIRQHLISTYGVGLDTAQIQVIVEEICGVKRYNHEFHEAKVAEFWRLLEEDASRSLTDANTLLRSDVRFGEGISSYDQGLIRKSFFKKWGVYPGSKRAGVIVKDKQRQRDSASTAAKSTNIAKQRQEARPTTNNDNEQLPPSDKVMPEVRAAIELLLDTLPDMTYLKVLVDEDGERTIVYRARRVQESSCSFTF